MIEAFPLAHPFTNCSAMGEPGDELMFIVATNVKLNASNVAGMHYNIIKVH